MEQDEKRDAAGIGSWQITIYLSLNRTLLRVRGKTVNNWVGTTNIKWDSLGQTEIYDHATL